MPVSGRTFIPRLEQLRKKYHDNADLSQGYVDKFLEDASNGKVFGVSKEKVGEIKSRRTKKAAKD